MSASEVDARLDAAIGALTAEVRDVAAKQDATSGKVDELAAAHEAGVARIAGLLDKPLVKRAGQAAGALAIAALVAATGYLQGKATPTTQSPVMLQPVTIIASPDGGVQ